MNQAILPFDITANRHKNNPQSAEANKTVDKSFWQVQVMLFADGRQDFTLKDACRFFSKPPNEISPRLSELKTLGLIEETGDRREKCAVLRLVKEKVK